MRRVKCVAIGAGIAFASVMAFSGSTAMAVVTDTITNNNSTVVVNDNPTALQPGHTITSWTVDGVQQNALTQFYFRIGAGALTNFDALNFTQANTTTTFANSTLATLYTDPGGQFRIQTNYILSGGLAGSGASDLAVKIRVTLLSGGPLDFHVYEYADMNLSGTPSNDSVTINNQATNGEEATQTDPNPTKLVEGSTFTLPNSTVTSPSSPSAYKTGAGGGSAATFLGSGFVTDPATSSAGPGDVAYAYRWDFSLGADPNGTDNVALISIDKNLVFTAPSPFVIPEPATTMLSGMGVFALFGSLIGRRSRRA